MMFALDPFPWFLRAGPVRLMQQQVPSLLRRLGVARRSEAADCLIDALSWRNWSFLVRTDKEFSDHRARMRASALEFRRLQQSSTATRRVKLKELS